jgi:hypothetical protein
MFVCVSEELSLKVSVVLQDRGRGLIEVIDVPSRNLQGNRSRRDNRRALQGVADD